MSTPASPTIRGVLSALKRGNKESGENGTTRGATVLKAVMSSLNFLSKDGKEKTSSRALLEETGKKPSQLVLSAAMKRASLASVFSEDSEVEETVQGEAHYMVNEEGYLLKQGQKYHKGIMQIIADLLKDAQEGDVEQLEELKRSYEQREMYGRRLLVKKEERLATQSAREATHVEKLRRKIVELQEHTDTDEDPITPRRAKVASPRHFVEPEDEAHEEEVQTLQQEIFSLKETILSMQGAAAELRVAADGDRKTIAGLQKVLRNVLRGVKLTARGMQHQVDEYRAGLEALKAQVNEALGGVEAQLVGVAQHLMDDVPGVHLWVIRTETDVEREKDRKREEKHAALGLNGQLLDLCDTVGELCNERVDKKGMIQLEQEMLETPDDAVQVKPVCHTLLKTAQPVFTSLRKSCSVIKKTVSDVAQQLDTARRQTVSLLHDLTEAKETNEAQSVELETVKETLEEHQAELVLTREKITLLKEKCLYIEEQMLTTAAKVKASINPKNMLRVAVKLHIEQRKTRRMTLLSCKVAWLRYLDVEALKKEIEILEEELRMVPVAVEQALSEPIPPQPISLPRSNVKKELPPQTVDEPPHHDQEQHPRHGVVCKVWCWKCGAGPYRNIGPCPDCKTVLFYGVNIAEEKKKFMFEEYEKALRKWVSERRHSPVVKPRDEECGGMESSILMEYKRNPRRAESEVVVKKTRREIIRKKCKGKDFNFLPEYDGLMLLPYSDEEELSELWSTRKKPPKAPHHHDAVEEMPEYTQATIACVAKGTTPHLCKTLPAPRLSGLGIPQQTNSPPGSPPTIPNPRAYKASRKRWLGRHYNTLQGCYPMTASNDIVVVPTAARDWTVTPHHPVPRPVDEAPKEQQPSKQCPPISVPTAPTCSFKEYLVHMRDPPLPPL